MFAPFPFAGGTNDGGFRSLYNVVDFEAGPAVYQAPQQETGVDDGILIEVLRGDDRVLASHTHMPGAWAGGLELRAGSFTYTGDGSGDIRLRIGPSNPGSGRFNGAIDNVTVSTGGGSGNWFDGAGLVDANQSGASADWGVSLMGSGQVAAGVGSPASTQTSTADGLDDGVAHVAILAKSGDTVSLYVDGAVDALTGVNGSARGNLDVAIGRLLNNGGWFTGDIAEIQLFDGALTEAEAELLNLRMREIYLGEPLNPRILDVTINTGLSDPPSLPTGPQPTSWAIQRTEIRTVQVHFNEPVRADENDFVLTNLGLHAPVDLDMTIPLSADHVSIDGNIVTLTFADKELFQGVYQLEVLASITDSTGLALDANGDGVPGDGLVHTGNETNKFYVLISEFNGDNSITAFDLPAFAYWFGKKVPAAPEYMDLNSDGGVSIFDFPALARNFNVGVTFPVGLTGNPGAAILPDNGSDDGTATDQRMKQLEQVVDRPAISVFQHASSRKRIDYVLNELEDEREGEEGLEQLLQVLAVDRLDFLA